MDVREINSLIESITPENFRENYLGILEQECKIETNFIGYNRIVSILRGTKEVIRFYLRKMYGDFEDDELDHYIIFDNELFYNLVSKLVEPVDIDYVLNNTPYWSWPKEQQHAYMEERYNKQTEKAFNIIKNSDNPELYCIAGFKRDNGLVVNVKQYEYSIVLENLERCPTLVITYTPDQVAEYFLNN